MNYLGLSRHHDYRNKVPVYYEMPKLMLAMVVISLVAMTLIGLFLCFIGLFLEGRFGLDVLLGLGLIGVSYLTARAVLLQPLRLYPDHLVVRKFSTRDLKIRFDELSRFDLRLRRVTHRDADGMRMGPDTIAEILVPIYKEGGERRFHKVKLPQSQGATQPF
ncbi:hypothetical protein [Sulfitobacter aestuariivivens]|uniref:hypothetical protein n=1 Tax=Sulfitobacter aestuariivivens TaxID=2766981 RepID=UPI00361992DE